VIFRELELAGAFVVAPEPARDERGFFARIFCEQEFGRHGLVTTFPQSSISFNARRHTLRGMHFQIAPAEEVKLVRCTSGAIYDVIVDLREGSPTRHRWAAVELSAENRLTLYIPEGFAHGFQTLTDGAEVAYDISRAYAPGLAGGVRFDDPALAIRWPDAPERIMSERDRAWPLIGA
jgi:dTDP-4-dehydrorhamnose 3,5-epimerase